MLKDCTKCGRGKPNEDFRKKKNGSKYCSRTSICTECLNNYSKEWRLKQKSKGKK